MNNELYHFGIQGMKWGVRRKRKTGWRRVGFWDVYIDDGDRQNIKKQRASQTYDYNHRSKYGRSKFDKITSSNADANTISNIVNKPVRKAYRVFSQEKDPYTGVQKAENVFAKDLGDLEYRFEFDRKEGARSTGALTLLGNERYYTCTFSDGHLETAGIYDARTDKQIG